MIEPVSARQRYSEQMFEEVGANMTRLRIEKEVPSNVPLPEARKRYDVKAVDVAEALGMSKQVYSSLERGLNLTEGRQAQVRLTFRILADVEDFKDRVKRRIEYAELNDLKQIADEIAAIAATQSEKAAREKKAYDKRNHELFMRLMPKHPLAQPETTEEKIKRLKRELDEAKAAIEAQKKAETEAPKPQP